VSPSKMVPLETFVQFHSRLPPTSRSPDTYNFLLDRALKATNRNRIVRFVLQDMERCNIRRNSTTWELLIINAAKHGDWEEAVHRIHAMGAQGLSPTLAGWAGLLEASTMAQAGWSKDMRLFSPRPLARKSLQLLQESSMVTAVDSIFRLYHSEMGMDDGAVVSIVRAFSKAGRIETAEAIVEATLARRIPSSEPPYPPTLLTHAPTSSLPTALPAPRLSDTRFATRLMHTLLIGKVRLRHSVNSLIDFISCFIDRHARFRPCFGQMTFYILVSALLSRSRLQRFQSAMDMADSLGHEFVGPRAARRILRYASDQLGQETGRDRQVLGETVRDWLEGPGKACLFGYEEGKGGMKPHALEKAQIEMDHVYTLIERKETRRRRESHGDGVDSHRVEEKSGDVKHREEVSAATPEMGKEPDV
jgi:hypothetical protein